MPSSEDSVNQLEKQISVMKADINSVKAKLESFGELRKANQDRFSQLNSLIGELRGMVLDLSKNMQRIEIATVKAVDKVEAVQPEKLMLEVRKVDAKVEALKANIESNEAMMNKLFEQIKEMRQTLTVFRSLDEIAKLVQEIKQDIATLQKVEANVERHSDKVESIFMEFQKEFNEFNQLTDMYKALNSQVQKLSAQLDTLNVKLGEKALKKDVEDLTNRTKKFEEHTSNILNLITKKANEMEERINKELKKFKQNIAADFEARGRRLNLLIKKLNELVQNNEKIAELLKLKPDELKPQQGVTEEKQE